MPIDYKKYCKDWKTRSRFIRFYRAKNHCEICNVPNHKMILRGIYRGVAVYQDYDGAIYREDNSEFVSFDYVGEVAKGMKPFIKVVLTVAHLDHDISNNGFFNLKAMCQKCHNNYDRDYRKSNRRKNRLITQPELFQNETSKNYRV